jgi:lysozyme family protein
MSDFNPAYQRVRDNEGEYSNDRNDRGGETYAGLCRRDDGDWAGWAIIDQVKAATPLPPANALPNSAAGASRVYGLALQYRLWVRSLNAALAARADLQSLVRNYYLQKYWRYAGVQSQDAATKIFDLAVDNGPDEACKITQKAANCQGRQLKVDGGWGPLTERAVNLCNSATLLNDIRRLAAQHSCAIATADPTQLEFLKGWLARDAQ